jgi:hypothetical protein
MVGVAEEEETYSSNEYKNVDLQNTDDEVATTGYFDEESDEYYSEEYSPDQNEVYYEESSVDFFTIFSEAFSGFVSSGALNVIIDLSTNSSSNSSDSNNSNSNSKSRNNSGSRNSDRR